MKLPPFHIKTFFGLAFIFAILVQLSNLHAVPSITVTGDVSPSTPPVDPYSTWIISTTFKIGNTTDGRVEVLGGGRVYASSDTVFGYHNMGGTGSLLINGTGSQFTSNSNFHVRNPGTGGLEVSDGGTLIVNGAFYASLSDLHGNGTIATKGIVADADIVFDSTHGITQTLAFGLGGGLTFDLTEDNGTFRTFGVGYKGNGSLMIREGSEITTDNSYLGYLSGSLGVATVKESGSKWNVGRFKVGNEGIGQLEISEGGVVTAEEASIGGSSSESSVVVKGSGSRLEVGGVSLFDGFYIGYNSGKGRLEISEGGVVNSVLASMTIGYLTAGSSGHVVVKDAGSKLETQNISIGTSTGTTGTLEILNGGVVETGGDATIGSNGVGLVTIDGTTSRWNMGSGLTVGNGGTLEISNGGTAKVDHSVTVKSGGSVLLEGGGFFTVLGLSGTTLKSGASIGGSGTIRGDVIFEYGSILLFDIYSTLHVIGEVSLDSQFGVEYLAGLTNATPNGEYTLITSTITDFSSLGINNWGIGNAYDLGNGKSAYFSEGSLKLTVIPEPSSMFILAALGLGFAFFRSRKRSLL